ncbi:basic secretory family protein [Arachidicoccus terrestris]|uniref:basic secretory family protein n=1 Tax=Arachidicoccus terrestris TaxID=2875539 RepID=UPI001CC74D73|nr:basic secretory family protein [Arachidicoccus terrestris]UAY56640.1 basic secretory family protein [Arachidicoccus terrestris]
MKMLKLNSKLLSVILLMLILAISCSKDTMDAAPGPDPNPDFEDIPVLDITSKATLTVSKDNPDGPDGVEGSTRLVDGDTTTKFLIKDFSLVNIDFQFDSSKLVASYQFTTGNDFDGRDPMDWKFYGSMDGKDWTLLDSRMGMQFRQRRTNYRFYFENDQGYTYYRWQVAKVYGADMFQASEFRLIQMPPSAQKAEPISWVDSTSKDGLKLIFVNHSEKENLSYQSMLTNTFFTVYPKLLETYNPDALKRIYFIVDPSYDGVAYSFGDVLVFSYDYMEAHPDEGDVAVHEIMHKIQNGYEGDVPGWLTEGIADYVRYRFGIDNPDSWSLPDYSPDQHYDDSYRVTARFLVWIENHKNRDFVQELDAALREGTNYKDFWVRILGKNIDELWAEYGGNPGL